MTTSSAYYNIYHNGARITRHPFTASDAESVIDFQFPLIPRAEFELRECDYPNMLDYDECKRVINAHREVA